MVVLPHPEGAENSIALPIALEFFVEYLTERLDGQRVVVPLVLFLHLVDQPQGLVAGADVVELHNEVVVGYQVAVEQLVHEAELVVDVDDGAQVGHLALERGCRGGTGKGIALEDQERIFDRFVKVDEYIPGTGLGLSVVQSHASHLGGTVGVESTIGEGSTFWVRLPIA